MNSADGLKQALEQIEMNIHYAQIDAIIDEIDYIGNKKIKYTELLFTTMSVQNFLNQLKINAQSQQFDIDESGNITAENIVLAMQELGHDITREELENIMDPHDLAKDAFNSKQEFKALLFDITY